MAPAASSGWELLFLPTRKWSTVVNHQDNKEDLRLFMNPSLLDKSLAENVKVEDATAAAVAAQAQIAALQAALASQQRQAAAQEAEKLQLQLLTVADAAEARAESLREAYEQAAAEAAAARAGRDRVKAIVAVHLNGHCVDVASLLGKVGI